MNQIDDNRGEGALPAWRRLGSPYSAYEVSDTGEVRRDGRCLKGYVDRYGYRTVLLSFAGTPKRFKVHRLVCLTFRGECPDGMQCAHLDGNPLNNRAENLAWVFPTENSAHKRQHGRPNGGATAILTDEEVSAIRQSDLSTRVAARKFGVSNGYISKLRNGKQRS